MTDMLRRRAAAITCLVVMLSALVSTQSGPRRIVSLVPALTEALFAIGAGSEVVGVGSFDTHPPEVASRARVGGLLDPDMEQIFRLRPDLVILYGSQRDQIEQLTRAGIPVFSYAHGGVADTLSVITEIRCR